MDEVRVNGSSNDFAVSLSEFFSLFREGDDFSGADEGEVQRIEEEDDPLALVVRELDLLGSLSVDISSLFEFRSRSEDLRNRVLRSGVHFGIFRFWIYFIIYYLRYARI